jgi:hypothetical protein
MDIALVLDKIRPGAAWRMCDTYENLVATWDDQVQTCPTLEEIETAWNIIQQGQQLDVVNADYSKRLAQLAYSYSKPDIMAAAGFITAAEAEINKADIVSEYLRLTQELLQKQNEIKGVQQ